MTNKLSVIVIGLFLLAGCRGNFTSREAGLIHNGAGVMRVWKINDHSDSLFLREKVKELGGRDLECSLYPKLKERMLLTVKDSVDPGVGIAAPQIGVGKALIAVQRFDKPGEPFEFYINPRIEAYGETKVPGPEGCLSIPDRMDSVWRSDEIIISYIPDPQYKKSDELTVGIHYERDLRRHTETVKGFTAVVFQHEIDHLNGILFIDRIKH